MIVKLNTEAVPVKAKAANTFLTSITATAKSIDQNSVHCASGINGQDTYLQLRGINSLIHAALIAYQAHHGLVLSPDVIWNTVASGAAAYIKDHSEELRSQFVKHQDKKFLEVRADWMTIKTGQEAIEDAKHMEAWAAVVSEFPNLMTEHMADPKVLGAFLADFSTTTLPSRIASCIVLMDAMSAYFEYGMSTMCGISYVKLLGTREDWQRLLDKTTTLLQKTGQKEWLTELQPVLQKFVQVFDGQADTEFWDDIFKYRRAGSGNPWVTGWINVFFPKLKTRDNPLMAYSTVCNKDWSRQMFASGDPGVEEYPAYVSAAEVKWANYVAGLTLEMELRAGVMQVAIVDGEVALEPRCAWYVVEKSRKELDPQDPFGKLGGSTTA